MKKKFYLCFMNKKEEYKKREKKRLRERHLKTNYNLSINDYNYMFYKQNGRCAICEKEAKLVVDHNHKTGEVRELLCTQCNAGIGHLKEDIFIMQEAINYILRHNSIKS